MKISFYHWMLSNTNTIFSFYKIYLAEADIKCEMNSRITMHKIKIPKTYLIFENAILDFV